RMAVPVGTSAIPAPRLSETIVFETLISAETAGMRLSPLLPKLRMTQFWMFRAAAEMKVTPLLPAAPTRGRPRRFTTSLAAALMVTPSPEVEPVVTKPADHAVLNVEGAAGVEGGPVGPTRTDDG